MLPRRRGGLDTRDSRRARPASALDRAGGRSHLVGLVPGLAPRVRVPAVNLELLHVRGLGRGRGGGRRRGFRRGAGGHHARRAERLTARGGATDRAPREGEHRSPTPASGRGDVSQGRPTPGRRGGRFWGGPCGGRPSGAPGRVRGSRPDLGRARSERRRDGLARVLFARVRSRAEVTRGGLQGEPRRTAAGWTDIFLAAPAGNRAPRTVFNLNGIRSVHFTKSTLDFSKTGSPYPSKP